MTVMDKLRAKFSHPAYQGREHLIKPDEDHDYIQVPYLILTHGLSRQALGLYVELVADTHDNQMLSDPAAVKIHKNSLASHAGVENGKSAYRYLDELKAQGWITMWESEKNFVRVWVVTDRQAHANA